MATSCDHDTVGQTLSYKVKDAIRRSTAMRTVDTYTQAGFTLQLVCLTPDPSASEHDSDYSYSLTMMNIGHGRRGGRRDGSPTAEFRQRNVNRMPSRFTANTHVRLVR